jgi:hypothetical protein
VLAGYFSWTCWWLISSIDAARRPIGCAAC